VNRKRVLIALVAAAVVGVLPGILPGAVAGAADAPVIGTAEPVLGPVSAILDASTSSVACPAAGECVAVGRFSGLTGDDRAFVLTMTDGAWGTAAEVAFGAGLENATPDANLSDVACAAPGECAAGGRFRDVAGYLRAFVVTMTGGVWGSATPISFGGVESATPDARVVTVSCGAIGSCAAGGSFDDTAGHRRAFVVTMTAGVWGTGAPVTIAGGVESATPDAKVGTVSCPAAGECVAGGYFTNTGGDRQAFTVPMTGGIWADGAPLTYSVAESATPGAAVESISCAAPGACVAGGAFENVSDATEAFVATMTGGVWAAATPVAYAGGQNATPDASVDAVSCAAAGECAAVGRYTDPAGDHPAFVRTMSGGSWSDATPVTFGAGVESANPDARATAVSCPAVGECVAGGRFSDGSGDPRGFVVTMTSGGWGTAEPITFPAGIESSPPSVYVRSLSCGATGACAAGGDFANAGGGERAYVVSMTGGTWSTATPVTMTVLGINPDANVRTIDCVTADECVAGGQLALTFGQQNAFVMTRTGGTWGAAQLVTFAPGVDAVTSDDRTVSVACAVPGECVAGGSFLDADGNSPAFVVTMTGGVWGAADPVVFAPGVESATPDAQVDSVTCTAPGECVAGGRFADAGGGIQAFVMAMTGGVWGTATPVTYSVPQDATPFARVSSVSCVATGACVAGGLFTDDAGNERAYVVTMTGGVWGTATPVAFPPGIENAIPDARTTAVECAAPGECVAGGTFRDVAAGNEAFVVTMTGGVWGTAIPLTYVDGQNATPQAYLEAAACGAVGECVAGGSFTDAAGDQQAFVVTMTGGVWGTATPLTYVGGQNAAPDDYVASVSCARAGECVAVGQYVDPAGGRRAFAMTMSAFRWSSARPVAFEGGIESATPGARADAVSCAPDGGCAAGGSFTDLADDRPAFVMPITLPAAAPVPEPNFTG
jgi:hypothetical protein